MDANCYWRVEVEEGYLVKYEIEGDIGKTYETQVASSLNNSSNYYVHEQPGVFVSSTNVMNFQVSNINNSFRLKWSSYKPQNYTFTEDCQDKIIIGTNGSFSGAVGLKDEGKRCLIRVLAPFDKFVKRLGIDKSFKFTQQRCLSLSL